MNEPNTEIGTDNYQLPCVSLRRSWMVVVSYMDVDGEINFYDEEFGNKAEAILHAAQQADKYGIGIHYGHECD